MVLPLVIHSGRHLFIPNANLSWMEVNFLNQKPCIPSWPGIFQFDIFFSVVLSKSVCISAFGPSLRPSSSLVISFIQSAFLLYFWLPYFCPKLLGFSWIRLLVCFSVISSQLLIEFSFIVLECLVLSVLFYPLSISLSSSFFRQYFLVYFLKLYCKFFLCCLFFSVPNNSSVFLLFYHFCLFL